ncbi:hypothetical protein Pcinc_006623, partial [Petrolisthes cinctipes]
KCYQDLRSDFFPQPVRVTVVPTPGSSDANATDRILSSCSEQQ